MTTVKSKNSFCDGHQKINISMKPKNHYRREGTIKKKKKAGVSIVKKCLSTAKDEAQT